MHYLLRTHRADAGLVRLLETGFLSVGSKTGVRDNHKLSQLYDICQICNSPTASDGLITLAMSSKPCVNRAGCNLGTG